MNYILKKSFVFLILFSAGSIFSAAGDSREIYFKNATGYDIPVVGLKGSDGTFKVNRPVVKGEQIYLGKAEEGDSFTYTYGGYGAKYVGNYGGSKDWQALSAIGSPHVLVTLEGGWTKFHIKLSAYEGHAQIPTSGSDRIFQLIMAQINLFKTSKNDLSRRIGAIIELVKKLGIHGESYERIREALQKYDQLIKETEVLGKAGNKEEGLKTLRDAHATLENARLLIAKGYAVLNNTN